MTRRLGLFLALLCLPATAGADTVKLANGDELNGEIVEWAIDYVVIDHPQLGRIRLSLDELDIDTGKPPRPGLFGTGFMRGWNRNFDFGWNGKKGQTNSLNITAGLNLDYADDFKRWLVTGRYFFNRSSDGDNDNNATVNLRRDWLLPESRWFAFADSRYQYDKFEDWKHRITATFGPGFHLVEREQHKLDVRVGPAFSREFGNRNRNKGEGLFALDYEWKIAADHVLALSSQLYFELVPDAGQLRNLTLGEWRILLREDPRMNLKIGASNEYETDTEPGEAPNDLKYYIALGLDF